MDLNAPLGKSTPPRGANRKVADKRNAATGESEGVARLSRPPAGPRRLGRAALMVGTLACVAAVVALGMALWTADPHGGEPYVVAAIPPQAAKPQPPKPEPVAPAQSRAVPPTPLDSIATGSLGPNTRPAPTASAGPPSPTGAPGLSQPTGPLIINVAKVLAERGQVATAEPPAAEPAPPPAVLPAGVPSRVAIFVSGMGLSSDATRTATELMPSAVGFAFVPYGETAATAVAAARARGHEILLQIPMRNAQGGAPGPHALQAGESAQQVEADVAWLMTRIEGYDGVANLLGAPVTSDRQVMGALLKAVSEHGLFYLDDGTSKRSLGPAVALADGVPAARADVVLDATADPAVVHANLEALVAVAKSKGSAIGMASGLPDHLAAIAAFAAGLESRGIRLVPVSALVGRGADRTVAK